MKEDLDRTDVVMRVCKAKFVENLKLIQKKELQKLINQAMGAKMAVGINRPVPL